MGYAGRPQMPTSADRRLHALCADQNGRAIETARRAGVVINHWAKSPILEGASARLLLRQLPGRTLWFWVPPVSAVAGGSVSARQKEDMARNSVQMQPAGVISSAARGSACWKALSATVGRSDVDL